MVPLSMTVIDPRPDFKVAIFSTLNISETTRDRAILPYYRTSIGSHRLSIEWWHFQWPSRTLFWRSRHFWSRISRKRYKQSYYSTLV